MFHVEQKKENQNKKIKTTHKNTKKLKKYYTCNKKKRNKEYEKHF